MERVLTKGGIYICDLNNVVGSEQGGVRPCIVVSNSMACIYSPTVLVIPITSKRKKAMSTHFNINGERYPCLYKDSIAITEQIRTIDKTRVREFIGALSTKDYNKLIQTIQENF